MFGRKQCLSSWSKHPFEENIYYMVMSLHVTLGCAADVQPVQTGLDLLDILQQVKGGSQGEAVGELPRGKLYSLGKGRWMLSLTKKMEVKAIFTGYYGKGKPVPIHGSRKGGAMQICTII